jgi:hypothetical protein
MRRGAERRDSIEPKRPERRQPKRDARRDVRQRAAPLVAVPRRIGQLADADAVEHDQERSGERRRATRAA